MTKLILLVEDNKQDELLTLRALRSHGLATEVIVCRDGEEAVHWLFGKGTFAGRDVEILPDVILLDLKLPKMDGNEVLLEIRSQLKTKRIPVVILTTSKEESDIAKSYDNGANSYVQKPISFDDFSEIIKRLGVYWLLTNEPPAEAGNWRARHGF